MARPQDVRRIALGLPETREEERRFAFSVLNKGKRKGIAWVWMERVDPKKPRVPNPKVLAVRVANQEEKEMLIAADPEKFFTEPHYNGFPAVLVRLASIGVAELRELIVDAWRAQSPKAVVEVFDRNPTSGVEPARRARATSRARPTSSRASGETRTPTPGGTGT
jgi:hypothetical protein